jgi:hypothetical protein
MLTMSCSACGHRITAADAAGLSTGVRRHVEAVCSGAAEPASPAFLAAVRRIRAEAVAVP